MKIYGKAGSPLTLHCKNVTRGSFQYVVWVTNANSPIKYTVFRYDRLGKVDIDPKFTNRIRRVNGTSIEIQNSRLTDSGGWECNLVFSYSDSNGRPRRRVHDTHFDVRIVSKLQRSM